MSKLLSKLSLLLTEEQLSLTSHDVEELLGSSQHFLLDTKVIVPTKPASHVICDACHLSHIEEVVRVKSHDGRIAFRIPCEEAGWVDVAEDSLRRWTIDFRCLVRNLALVSVPTSSVNELILGFAWKLGSVGINGKHHDLILIRETQNGEEESWTNLLHVIVPNRTILLSLKNVNTDKRFAACLLISDAFGCDYNKFSIRVDRLRELVSSNTELAEHVFMRRGDFWELKFDGTTVHLKDSVGIGYIARLLLEPNREIAAVTLLAARAGIDPLVTTGSSGEILDQQAREQYAVRYSELRDDLNEAKRMNDIGRMEIVEFEMEQLTSQLAAATGVGGRSRKSDDGEKIRKSVREAISRDLDRIEVAHKTLGKHLLKSIITGFTCRYSPEKDLAWHT